MADGVEVPQLNESNALQGLTPDIATIDRKGEIPTLANLKGAQSDLFETLLNFELMVVRDEIPPGGRFTRASFDGADFKSADLRTLAFWGATFREANLSRTNLSGANLRHAVFTNANLAKADLRMIDGRLADFRGADLRGADLRGANLTSADFRGADLRDARLNTVSGGFCNFDGANFDSAHLEDSVLRVATFRDAQNLHKAKLRGADLRGADLGGLTLAGADMRRTNLHNARLADVTWTSGESDFPELIYFIGGPSPSPAADVEGANLKGAGLGAIFFVGRVAPSESHREIFLLSSVLGGAVVWVGCRTFGLSNFRKELAALPESEDLICALNFLEGQLPAARRRKAHDLGMFV